MLTKKDKKILNQKSMIHNRDILIEDMQKKNEELSNENIAVYEENKDLRFENEGIRDIIKEIDNLAKTQQYGSVQNLQNKKHTNDRKINLVCNKNN